MPSFLAFAVTNLLEQHFTQLVDYEFTAQMEDDLDRIAAGDEERTTWLRRFYFGDDGDEGLKELVSDLGEIDARAINTIEIGDGIELRVGRYGPYIERDGERGRRSRRDRPGRADGRAGRGAARRRPPTNASSAPTPTPAATVVVKNGRYGPYVTEVAEDGEKPRTASLFKSMSPETVTLEDALRCSRSRASSVPTADGEEVVASNGRYGPFVSEGKDTRSLESEEQLFTITLEEALALLAQPKQRGRRRGAAPLRELGVDPVSGKPIVVEERPVRAVRHRRRDEREPPLAATTSRR